MIKFDETLRYVPGYIYGLQHPGLLGGLEVSGDYRLYAAVENALLRFLEIELPPGAVPGGEPAASVVRLLELLVAWQQRQLIITPNGFYLSQPRQGPGSQRYTFMLPYSLPAQVMSRVLAWMVRLYMAAREDSDSEAGRLASLQQEFSEFTESLKPFFAPSINRFRLAQAAFRLEIPIHPKRGDIYQMGIGRYRRLVSSSITDATPAIGVSIAKNKAHTADVLRQAGFPAATHDLARNPEHAAKIAKHLGFPVVVKPADLDEGRGVAADLRDEKSVRDGFEQASAISRQVLVEKHVAGFTHRMTVFQGNVIKVVKRIAGGVTGDGTLSIRELVTKVQGETHQRFQTRRHGGPVISLDDEAIQVLQKQQLSAESIPEDGCYVRLRAKDNVSAGGRNQPLPLDQVHPDNLVLARRAAQLLNLDFAGVDLIIDDIARSWLQGNAVICEINAQPTLGAKDDPDIYLDILNGIMTAGSRVPVFVVLIARGATYSDEECAQLQAKLNCQGLSRKAGLWLDSQQIANAFPDGFAAARALLNNPDLDSALLVLEFEEVARFGLPTDRVVELHLVEAAEDQTSQEERDAVLNGIAPHVEKMITLPL